MNRLGGSASPYLLQHATNPVDWWPWGEEALAEAVRLDRPILLSVGYAACHWCHVMAHESFADAAVAEALNRDFVAIKVDREERPDIDAVYMAATQAMTGQGGWPMTVFATPEGQPFYCGTYYPRPHFLTLLQAVGTAWRERRDALVRQGAAVVQAIAGSPAADGVPDIDNGLLAAAAGQLAEEFDEVHGGFGAAPKFPPHMCLLFLLRHYQRTGDRRSLELVAHTAEQMARGGLYDQLAGGFARYSVDERWLVPHFEKMLYDNALLLRVYTQLWRLTGDPLAGRVARSCVAFLRDALGTAQGGFASSLDADTDGVEGGTYVWTPQQLRDVLGADDAGLAAELFGVTESGTFEHGTSVLRLTRDVDAADEPVAEDWRRVSAALVAARDRRAQPTRDDKVVAAWNGLAIVALVEFGFVADAATPAGISDELAAQAFTLAVRAAHLLASTHLVGGRLRRVSRDGVAAAAPAVLEDYGAVAEAFCAVHQLTGEGRWLQLAGELLDVAVHHFADGRGGFYDTADDAPALVKRPADLTDNATPSGCSTVCAALISYAALTGESRYRLLAGTALAATGGLLPRHARFAGYASATAEALAAGPSEIAIADPDRGSELLRQAWRSAPPGSVIVWGRPDQAGVPLLQDRVMRDGRPTAYVCRDFVCAAPVTDAAQLAAQLTTWPVIAA